MKWILDFAKRLARVDRKGRSRFTTFLSTLGICVGVMTLITVVGVMNGFQMSFIDSIMEISSYHIRAKVPGNQDFEEKLNTQTFNRDIKCVVPFYESQGLITAQKSTEMPVILRGVPQNIREIDSGFNSELKIIRGNFDLSSPQTIVLGSELANSIGAYVGSKVNLLALSGSKDVQLLSQNREFYVSGIFECGYLDINASFAFVGNQNVSEIFGKDADPIYGIKLKDYKKDFSLVQKITKILNKDDYMKDSDIKSWREYNRSFFGALRIEKNILMLLVLLIFIVVGINIYNGMRRLVFERKSEIAILNALGGSKKDVQSIFVFQGLLNGVKGSLCGLVLGLLITLNMKSVFIGVSKVLYFFEWLFTSIFAPSNAMYIQENPMFKVYASIPARVLPAEVILICVFGIASPLIACWLASKNVLRMNVAEVLHDE